MTMANNDPNMLDQVQAYRAIVATYEDLKTAIHKLLSSEGGNADELSADALKRYRALARKRDETLNEMRVLEQLLLDQD